MRKTRRRAGEVPCADDLSQDTVSDMANPAPPTVSATVPMGIRAWTSQRDKGPRAWSETVGGKAPRRSKDARRKYPHEALVFDTETRDEAGQGLLFGIWRLYSDNIGTDPVTHLVEEGLFYPDDLAVTDPAGWATLREYVATHRAADVAPGNHKRIHLWPVSRWLEERLYRYGFKHRTYANVVGFNLPFDLGGLARHFGPARPSRSGSGIDYFGGWSLSFWGEHRPDGTWRGPRYKPWLHLKSIDPRRTLIGWVPVQDDEPREVAKGPGGGRFVDLRTLAFALTDKSLTLEGACRLFGHEYVKQDVEYGTITSKLIAYGRDDVAATATLYRDCLTELSKHPGIDLPPHRLYSPATVGARYLQAMGLAEPLTQHVLSEELLGECMSAFYGGRAEARIVRVPLPVVVADFTSMYPAQNALLGTWPILTADNLTIEDVTDHVRDLVADPDLFTRLHARETWSDDIGVTFVQLADIDGAVLPVRAAYEPPRPHADGRVVDSGSLGIGVNPLHYNGTLTYGLPDVLAAALLGPAAFTVVKATRLHHVGTQGGLRTVQLRGTTPLDPGERDPFLVMIEERHRVKHDPDLDRNERERLDLFLKITANATSYGSLARFDSADKPHPVDVTAYAPNVRIQTKTSSPETPGPYCFPPVAASITAGARLMLALIETHVTRAGGSYAFMDTDSIAIVAAPAGGHVPCPGEPDGVLAVLSHDEVRTILRAFDDLNPYGPDVINPDRAMPRSPWKVEHDSLAAPLSAYVISAKRYLLYRGEADSPTLVYAAEHDAEDTDAEDASSPKSERDSLDMSHPLDIADWSEHGLGLYLDPLGIRDDEGRRVWMREAWNYTLRRALGLDADLPAWADKPALTQFTMSSPRQRRWFGQRDSGRPNDATPRPGGFGILGQTAPSSTLGPNTPMPATRFTNNPDEWLTADWYDRRTGKPLRLITADPETAPDLYAEQLAAGSIELATLGRVVNRYRARPEHKSMSPDGTPAGPTTKGKLRRRPIYAHTATTRLIGKESNKLAERLTDPESAAGRTVVEYGTIGDEWTDVILPILRRMGPKRVARETGITERRVRAWYTGARPHLGPSGHMASAIRAARGHADKEITPTSTE